MRDSPVFTNKILNEWTFDAPIRQAFVVDMIERKEDLGNAIALNSDFFLYLMGRKYGRMLVEHKRFRRIISSNRLSELEEKFKKRGVWVGQVMGAAHGGDYFLLEIKP